MAPSLKIASLVAAVLLLATAQARGWAPEEDDMVPVRTPAGQVVVTLPRGAGTMAGSSLCLQCRCCSKSNPEPGNCKITNCTSSFQCDRYPAGKCHLVQDKCGCN